MCTHHHTQLIFVFLVEMGFHHVGQAGLKLLTSGYPPASASHSTGILGMSHPAICSFLTGTLQHLLGQFEIQWKNPIHVYYLDTVLSRCLWEVSGTEESGGQQFNPEE
uniref:Uncharacterized protein n=1 Tax=Theropithecus gelada TaxID=9565 RepID=A0A8D2K0K1_THEGE